MTEHTPGPWVGFSDQGKDVAILPAGKDGTICDFSEPYPSRADAQVMIAAPDLLRAAKRLDTWWREEWPEGPEDSDAAIRLTDETISIWRDFITAIAKATSE